MAKMACTRSIRPPNGQQSAVASPLLTYAIVHLGERNLSNEDTSAAHSILPLFMKLLVRL